MWKKVGKLRGQALLKGWMWGRSGATRGPRAPGIGHHCILGWALVFMGLGSRCPQTPTGARVWGSGCREGLESLSGLRTVPKGPLPAVHDNGSLGQPRGP